MSGQWLGRSLALLTTACVLVGGAQAGAPDRLDRFRVLAESRLGAAQLGDDAAAAETYREIYALLDEEIVDNLSSGGPFASLAFVQDRLDAFTEAWGSTMVHVIRVGPLTVGAFELSDAGHGNTVRVYGRLHATPGPMASAAISDGGSHAHDAIGLLGTLSRDGRPAIVPLPAPDAATAQFLVAWEGAATGRGTRALRIDQVRQRGDNVHVVWSTADEFPDGLMAREYVIRGHDVRVRYETRYPGWAPGCDGQTEREDVYRLAAPAATFTRVARHDVNTWHREVHGSAARLFSALSSGDARALIALVPDAAVRNALPRTLHAEPACDAPDATTPSRVSIAASAAEGPWQLTFQKSGAQWHLVHATPVLQ